MKKFKLIKRFRSLGRKQKLAVGLGFILLVAGLTYAYLVLFQDRPAANIFEEPKYYSKLTGEEVPKEQAENPILAVMIENSEEARPQTGLDSAGIVFETVTEGGITRFMALYQTEFPKEIGPIRSLRPAFVDWFMGFDASVAHVGGSATALEMVQRRDARSLNEFTNATYYYRSDKRAAPHNVYALTSKLRELQASKDHERSNFELFARSQDMPNPEPTAGLINVSFSYDLFSTQYRYNSAANGYTRYMAGKPHIDAATGNPITIKNLVVLQHPSISKQGVGKGNALIFKDGNVVKAMWEKQSYNSQIKLTYQLEGEVRPVELNVGDSWFAAVPTLDRVSYSAMPEKTD